MKKYLYAIGAWFISLILIFAFPRDIPIITGDVFLCFYLVGLIFVIVFLIVLIVKPKKLEPLLAVSLVLLICIVTFNKGVRWGAMVHLFTNKGRYEGIVMRLAATKNVEERERICGDDCMILSDEPLRVAFHYCHFFLNWKDIVHDPTGEVNVGFLPPDRRLSIYFIRGERLYGDWYLGHFGD